MMKGSAPALATTQTADKSGLGMYLELAKARLTALVLFTTLAGFCVGSKGWPEFGLMTSILIGTALVASGAAALNQLIEKDYDSRMLRTESRPLPSGRIQPETVLVFGIGIASVGLVWLAIGVNLLTSLLGALTLLSYLFVYTPLKRVTTLNTTVSDFRSVATADGMDSRAWRNRKGRFGSVCHSFPLAIATLHVDSLDVQGGIR